MKKGILILLAVALIAVVTVLSGCAAEWHANEQNITGTVSSKFIDIGHNSDGKTVSYYMVNIVTPDGGHKTLEIRRANEWFDLSENPDWLYGELREGHTYEFKTYGFDVQIPGEYMYPIIASYREIK
jgi:hypothetical protein